MKICIVGAGVVGLCTALEIQNQFPNLNITIIADKFNEDTTSDGAAGLFLAFDHFVGPTEHITTKWINHSYKYYDKLIKNEDCGIFRISGYSFSNISHNDCLYKCMKNDSVEYQFLNVDELSQFNIKYKFGVKISTLGIPCRKFLPWCIEKFKKNDGHVIHKKIYNFDALEKEYDAIFNCSGMNAKFLCNDNNIYPIRGQVMQVKSTWIKHFYKFDSNFIIPCGYDDKITLGGTYDFGSFNTEVNEYITSSIIDKCSQFLPDLNNVSVIRNWVGLRPYRTVVRVELEPRNSAMLIHNYGHGGCGVTAAPGTSLHAVNLFRDFHLYRKNYSKL